MVSRNKVTSGRYYLRRGAKVRVLTAGEVSARVRYEDGIELDVSSDELVPLSTVGMRPAVPAPGTPSNGEMQTTPLPSPSLGEFQCPDCPRRFGSKVGLGHHRRRTHGYRSEKAIKQQEARANMKGFLKASAYWPARETARWWRSEVL